MKLVGVKLRNFRCYKEEISIQADNLLCVIGKNDVGKSSILEALNAFFNDEIDKCDLSTNADDKTIEITCYFDEIPDSIVLDSSIETSPKTEYLLNNDGYLQVKKVYSVGKTLSKSIFLIAHHSTHAKIINILSLKNTPLKSLAEELDVDFNGINKSKNPPLRKAIRDHIKSDFSEVEIKVDGNIDGESNLKTIWSKLKKALPIYSLFKVDKNLDDKDKDVQDPMKLAIKEALATAELQPLMERIENAIKVKSTEVADLTLEKLKDIDPKLAEKMRAEFGKQPAWEKIFDLTLLNDQDIPLNKRGSGIRRLVLLSFFRAQAEARKYEHNAPSIIYAIEEPETSQHPNHQKIIIDSFIDLSESDNVQVFFTTHSANLVREIPIESLVYISNKDGISVSYGVNIQSGENNETTLTAIIKTLGVLPDPRDTIKLLLYLEGNHDIEALTRYSEILSHHNHINVNLKNSNAIGFVISGGSSLKFYVENQYLKGLGKPEIHLYDNDVEDYREKVKQINADQDNRRKAFNTAKLELENYLTREAIVEAYADNGTTITLPETTDEMDVPNTVPNTVAKALYEQSGENKIWENDLNDIQKSKKVSRVKRFLNTQVVDKMTVERIVERNALDEMKGWFENIHALASEKSQEDVVA
jgi:predicted ATP-dependent endonuclease of OLD family